MVDIMSHLHKYVPTVECDEEVKVPDTDETVTIKQANIHRILFGGDQLTAARARGANKARINSVSPMKLLEGLTPCVEDWHAKLNLLEVCN